MEGILKLKKDSGGFRHYIELPDGRQKDIHCGRILEIQLGKWVEIPNGEKLVPDQWLTGRYEADLCSDKPTAYLYLGYAMPCGIPLACVIPLDIRVRIPEI